MTDDTERASCWHSQAELDEAKRGAKELGRILDRTLTMALDASGRHDLINEDGDGDWEIVWETLAGLRPRAERAEAERDAALAQLERVAVICAEWDARLRRDMADDEDANMVTVTYAAASRRIRETLADPEGGA